mgnify:CR=1 FL=1
MLHRGLGSSWPGHGSSCRVLQAPVTLSPICVTQLRVTVLLLLPWRQLARQQLERLAAGRARCAACSRGRHVRRCCRRGPPAAARDRALLNKRGHMCVRACKCQVCCCGNSDALRTDPKAQGGMTGQHSRCHAQDLCMCRQGVCMQLRGQQSSARYNSSWQLLLTSLS